MANKHERKRLKTTDTEPSTSIPILNRSITRSMTTSNYTIPSAATENQSRPITRSITKSITTNTIIITASNNPFSDIVIEQHQPNGTSCHRNLIHSNTPRTSQQRNVTISNTGHKRQINWDEIENIPSDNENNNQQENIIQENNWDNIGNIPNRLGNEEQQIDIQHDTNMNIEDDNIEPTTENIVLPLQVANANEIDMENNDNFLLQCRGRVGMSAGIQKHCIGEMAIMCNKCNAISFPGEGQTFACCRKGAVHLPPIKYNTNNIIYKLLNNIHEESDHFLKNIRYYNTQFAFASLGANIVHPEGRGPYAFKVQGTVYHKQSSIMPQADQHPSFAQLYVLDPSEAANERLRENTRCSAHLVTQLSEFFAAYSPFAQLYRQMGEYLQQHPEDITRIHFNLRQTDRRQTNERQTDPRRYNLPAVSEIAFVFRSDDGELTEPRDIAIYPLNSAPTRISQNSPLIDALLYPIFFPYGDHSWTFGLYRQGRNGNISIRDYYSFRLAIRPNEFNPILRGKNLCQQYFVDVYCRIEHSRLQYLRMNQKKLRMDLYDGLMDYIQNHTTGDVPAGRCIILPSSFTGSPRYMMQRFQDALTLVAHCGKPDLFITLTCNPNWMEIKSNLLPGQSPCDRPDIISRVFELKYRAIIKEIVVEKIFGPVSGYTYSIEFQKRGLPHMHLLVILNKNFKLNGNEDIIDKVVCAEIPDHVAHSNLHKLVCAHMIHGPCGNLNKSSPCMAINKDTNILTCTKKYPRDYVHTTHVRGNSYPVYRRRPNITSTIVRGHELDNRWVVPYNPYLLERFESHINVEVCSTIKVVKYIYKYFFKGHDRASVEIQQEPIVEGRQINLDEIKQYIDCRYVSAPEAAWRIQGHSTCGSSHSVFTLSLHLPDRQWVLFEDGDEHNALQNARQTSLVAWFELNTRDEEARRFNYIEIPLHYRFNKKTGIWSRRKRNVKILGRLPLCHAGHGEKFYLRLLLLRVKGATSFDNLKTVSGRVYNTFQEAANALGLLTNDDEFRSTIREAIEYQMPRQMRRLFVMILVYGGVMNPLGLWNEFADELAQGFLPVETARDRCLSSLQHQLQALGSNLSSFGLPLPTHGNGVPEEDNISVNQYIINQHELETHYQQLNQQQNEVVTEILTAIDNVGRDRNCFFLDGPGGTGKTFVYNVLSSILESQGKTVIKVASTGIAATLLRDGQTAHSKFKIPVPCYHDSICNISVHSDEGQAIHTACLIIWDEAPMSNRMVFQAVDRLLQDMEKCTKPFGGKVILLGGDFRQTLPVIPKASSEASLDALIINSPLWHYFKILKLTQNMRAGVDERVFADWLLGVGDGTANMSPPNNTMINLQGPQMCKTIVQLIDKVYGTTFDCINTNVCNRAILCSRNDQCNMINTNVLKRLKGEESQYNSTDVQLDIEMDRSIAFPTEFLNSITLPGMPPHRLILKKGAIIMLLRNINVKCGLCNGTRLRVLDLGLHVIVAEAITGCNAGERVIIPRVTLHSKEEMDSPCLFSRRQFPVRLSYAMTINKSQGQTLETVGVALQTPVFAHGQLYVALSRSTSMNKIYVQIPTFPDTKTKNIVLIDNI